MKKQTFDHLVSLAQQESAPHIDVADAVFSALAALVYKKPDPYRTYTWVGAASVAVAACIGVVAVLSWHSNADSVDEIMTYVSWVAQ